MLVHKFEIGYVVLCWILERVFESDRILLLVFSVMIMGSQDCSDGFCGSGHVYHAIIFWRQLAAMMARLYQALFLQKEHNKALELQKRYVPRLYTPPV